MSSINLNRPLDHIEDHLTGIIEMQLAVSLVII